MQKNSAIVGVKELRQNLDSYISQIQKGNSFIIVKRSRPVFKISPINKEEIWEEVVDFTKIKKGGVKIEEILSRI
ncbi:MAG: hypothetical protein A2469_01980 [Candidatus Magasanikbacteria bacterium RIFOXYC2_FULL_40_16]|uniref:Antitoxin n=3 Tax=Candidatus Magasanikiibacteriota TaxID=1752731 RepID=A0A1F6NH75_9BACT|nr:MAG: hypothetical protein A2373_04615 [Candidatus Magasanikbacteria bacterium RIFOXYB1_FULL_40_15]OGH87006.1 MAG: hypothetical protein A2301_00045 [Candidatus Magasanikbacteria bacterium RIFOXYB2_FULL_40_13]OGH87856.1 MAG: hypothetical protein A2206_04040 [Candidatus Magasanikbacteria bacterium RIFOXYA1_FULL_40_8]OGH89581.1 MAG: hypothetical protein A2469_01980 [Candidatus Magasanikbacteria bacterium RIFOXYC2_FULL_40_16]